MASPLVYADERAALPVTEHVIVQSIDASGLRVME
jgi:hypothetical protein